MEDNPLPVIAPNIFASDPISDEIAMAKARDVLERLNGAMLVTKDANDLEQCFFSEQAYWRDQIALTWHLRTFSNRRVIATSLLEMSSLRVADDGFKIDGHAHFIPALQMIGFAFSFNTKAPEAKCSGRAMLLPSEEVDPERDTNHIVWKIWTLSTWIEQLDLQQEDEILLRAPGRKLDAVEHIETEVVIIGGGNAGVTIAARLKALDVESVIVERNPRAGDNWARRYDCLCFHIPTSCCELPYTIPHLLTRGELAQHVLQYAENFNLNMIISAKILHTQYDTKAKRWTVKVQTPSCETMVVCKHLVQATGFGSQKPYMPPMQNVDLYKGVSIHSNGYKTAKELVEKGVKSVLVVGSANTAFDIMEDCHAAGLRTTMAVRSPTYLLPMEYMSQPETLGIYDQLGAEAADRLFQTGPTVVDSALLQSTLRRMARSEPDRYAGLAAAGFPALDSAHPDAVLNSNLLERAGGHYVDVGGTALLASGEVGVKKGEPTGFYEHGLTFRDGSSVGADAVVWCTGFADKDYRTTAAEVLGGSGATLGHHDKLALDDGDGDILGPHEIAARLDATWGLDDEGEIRGLAKRQRRAENYWAIGGPAPISRWYSKLLAIQIKAELEGVLPAAYLGSPGSTEWA
ncbi:monooxygenase [Apiospora kogelbergensis]|uniref:monooxygenase n=1 Tax=Apiospora kogelbergensis TaxID=1337665 RepID=UPI00312F4FBB